MPVPATLPTTDRAIAKGLRFTFHLPFFSEWETVAAVSHLVLSSAFAVASVVELVPDPFRRLFVAVAHNGRVVYSFAG